MTKEIPNPNNEILPGWTRILKSAATLFLVSWVLLCVHATEASGEREFVDDIRFFSSLGDRSTGTPGCEAAAAYIKRRFTEIGFDKVDSHLFSVPVRIHGESSLHLPDRGIRSPIQPLRCNAISPGATPPGGIEGPLIYVGAGELASFNGKTIEGSVILMELDSGKNWLNAANIGAGAVIYVDRGDSSRFDYEDKYELSPMNMPRFRLALSEARAILGAFETAPGGLVSPRVRLHSSVAWRSVEARNVYAYLPGADPELEKELVIVEAFYDSTALVYGKSPGADEAVSAATLLETARALKRRPPARSVMLVATAGHGQTLAGMREMVWSFQARSRHFRTMRKRLKKIMAESDEIMTHISDMGEDPFSGEIPDDVLYKVLNDQIKTEVDVISRRLMRLRMETGNGAGAPDTRRLAERRRLLRMLGWRTEYADLTEEERRELNRLVPLAAARRRGILEDATRELAHLKSAKKFRNLVREKEVAGVVSLHLSSHGDGVGAFNNGFLHKLKKTIRRVVAYSVLDEVLRQSAERLEQSRGPGRSVPLRDTLRPSKRRTWQSHLPDKPALGGEVSALAGMLGVSLATTGDVRLARGTPYDLPDRIDWEYAEGQGELVSGLIESMARAPVLRKGGRIREGFSTVLGRAKFLRHGELFADLPAPDSVMLSYQGPGRYYTMVNSMGLFHIKGVADKKHVLDKVIIEGYRFDEETGAVKWAIDKKLTGKPAYRVKMQRRNMETDVVMFACKQTTIFDLLEPRTFRPMTKIQLLDGRRETEPRRYWYSRIDTRVSTICSIYMEPDARLKLTLSDTVLRKKMILTNATGNRPEGVGYRIDQWPEIHRTGYRTARDMWALLGPRVSNLENHGIKDDGIRSIQRQGLDALERARKALEEKRYDLFNEAAATSWALASRVYDQVERTQKDVLFGVLFYIALFVPFAFCMERLLFSFTGIHARILAFFAILMLLIAVIYKVHPAFQLAYSPSVVILAFFIMGLSLMVTLIIFFRFEEEMVLLQRRAARMRPMEISRWKAFAAAFFLGVSNLRRRRLRTGLTCLTLIILTFTIMSFTAVKTTRHHARILYDPDASYQGLLLKNTDWRDLPVEALETLTGAFGENAVVMPRVHLESEDRTKSVRLPVRFGDRVYEARGATGLSAREGSVTGLDEILVGGRWHREEERRVVLLPERMARSLGVDPGAPGEVEVMLWGAPFRVVGVFSGRKLMERTDLDGEALTPVTFPREASTDMTEIEMEAMESGEDVRAFQSRYEHAPGDLTLIFPHRTLLGAGGKLKGAAVRFPPGIDTRAKARLLVDRFGLSLYSGEKEGVFLYHAGDAMNYSGAPNILIPLVISVFIVLNTMIGSVYERKSEIAIYTSVGLAPSHVAFLFVAEAMAFAVLSTVLGYILAQVSAGLFAETPLWAGLTVNYSSLTGVAAMVLVMLVVLVSVIYPSRVAARIAIPDVNRSWKMPDPKKNRFELTLPFLLKPGEERGVGGYLLSYLQGHQDISHGLFSTADIMCIREFPPEIPPENAGPPGGREEAPSCLHLQSRVWLAPFDFGIMQRVEFLFRPSEQLPGHMEIGVTLEREAGEANAWGRINRTFINDLRKQLLIWRSLDRTEAEYYEEIL